MRLTAGKQMSDTLPVGAVLALTGGFLDVHTYLLRGGVFANAETGNIVLLGLNLAQGNFLKALYYLIPILAYAAGVLTAEAIRKRCAPRFLHWRQTVVALEFLLVLAAAFVPAGEGSAFWNTAVNLSVAFVCAMQVESFRKLKGSAYATTMCTGNLRSGTECLWRFFQSRDPEEGRRVLRYYGVILLFTAGAVLGTVFTRLFAQRALLICCGLLALAFLFMFWKEDAPA